MDAFMFILFDSFSDPVAFIISICKSKMSKQVQTMRAHMHTGIE